VPIQYLDSLHCKTMLTQSTPRAPLRRSAAKPSTAAVAFLVASLIGSSATFADEPRFGVNRVNLAWVSSDARRQILDQMAAAGVKFVRLSLTPPFEESLDAVRIAHERGMRVLLEISLSNKDFYPPGAKRRPGFGRVWDMYRLSDIDPEKFRTVLRAAFRRIDELGVALDAVQPGNEINWGGYNGDLAVYPKANVRTARSLNDVNNRSSLERGADKYVLIARIVREELAATQNSKQAKVVSAGLSDMPAEFADKRGIERLDSTEFAEILRARGIEDYIDAYGVHLYPSVSASPKVRRQHIESAMSFCAAPENGKSCWVTEWGVANTSNVCPPDDTGREQVVHELREVFEEFMHAKRLSAALYFDWDSKTPYSVWRCDALTPAGRAAVVPSPSAQ